MAPKKNFYAVKKGYDKVNEQEIYNKIYTSWEEAKLVVMGISKKVCGISPEYQGFYELEEAREYLRFEPYLNKGDNTYPQDVLHCYVDGSCTSDGSYYSHGVAFVKDKKVIHTLKGFGNKPEVVAQRQVGGELTGAMLSLIYARNQGFKELVVFFDYKGVACHALGTWKRETDIAIKYYDWMQKFFKDNPEIKVTFCKVDAHTGDEFNEIADGLAKSALGIPPDAISIQYAEKHNILHALSVD